MQTPICRASANRMIVIRTHFIDDHMLALAASLGRGGVYDVAFAVDERKMVHDTGAFAKIPVTVEAIADLGLDVSTGDTLWRCGDYIFYMAFEAYPDAEYIWLIENDVSVNFTDPRTPFLLLDRDSQHDLLTTYLEPAPEDWFWTQWMKTRVPEVHRCFFPVVRLSRRAGAVLLEQRRSDLRQHGNDWKLANDESFVASVVIAHGMSAGDIAEFANVYDRTNFRYGYPVHHAAIVAPDDRFYHPVKSGIEFLKSKVADPAFTSDDLISLLRNDAPFRSGSLQEPLFNFLRREMASVKDDGQDVFQDGSLVTRLLQIDCSPPVLQAIVRAMAIHNLGSCIDLIRNGWAGSIESRTQLQNIALGKPAHQSSTCEWSTDSDPIRDASGLTNGLTKDPYYNHTGNEIDPWWQVDLLSLYPISTVRIHNRSDIPERLAGYSISVSDDGSKWRTIFTHDGATPVATVETVDLDRFEIGRHVRLTVTGTTCLHLREVEIYRAQSSGND